MKIQEVIILIKLKGEDCHRKVVADKEQLIEVLKYFTYDGVLDLKVESEEIQLVNLAV